MKNLLTLICVLFTLVYMGSSQTKPNKFKIDKNLKHNLFDFLPYGVHGDPNSDVETEFVSNALIIEPNNNKHKAFDTCRSYFSKDTLVVEFRSITPFFTDKLILKIKNKNYWSYLVNEGAKIEIIGMPKSLIFKKKIKTKGQEIFGELAADFFSEKLNQTFSYAGPFRCIVE